MNKMEQLDLGYEILPPWLAIKSMRSSGYRDTAHAVAELIDNSIQAGLEVNDRTNVELLCIDKTETVSRHKRQQIERIAVYDNASGMDAKTLRIALQFGNGTHLGSDKQGGIGKFGMGLPNASISQCCRVDVWSWQNGRCLHTYLDVDEIIVGTLREVPEPTESEIPDQWRGLIRDEICSHGTLVVWSRLDRVRWKTSSTFLNKAEFLVGRMYRYFLKDKTASIRLAAFDQFMGKLTPTIDYELKPNDPMYLMTNTCAPEPYDKKPAFDLVDEREISIKCNGEEHKVVLRFSVVKPEVREEGGSAPIGKDAKKNQGVSVVRARRELEMNSSFDNSYDPRERWWGVEVLFDPPLDEVFGVTNNKQAATAFRALDREEDAKAEDFASWQAYREALEQSNDPRLAIYELSHEIKNTLNTLREQIKRMREGSRSEGDLLPGAGSAEDIATRATRRRRQEIGDKGQSDKDEDLPTRKRQDELTDTLIEEGVPEKEAREIAVEAVTKNIKYLFQEADVPGPAIFDIKSKAGTIIILINSKHPARDNLFELLQEENCDKDTPALRSLKLLLTAWARLEDEAEDRKRQDLEDVRLDWGRIARDFLQVADE